MAFVGELSSTASASNWTPAARIFPRTAVRDQEIRPRAPQALRPFRSSMRTLSSSSRRGRSRCCRAPSCALSSGLACRSDEKVSERGFNIYFLNHGPSKKHELLAHAHRNGEVKDQRILVPRCLSTCAPGLRGLRSTSFLAISGVITMDENIASRGLERQHTSVSSMRQYRRTCREHHGDEHEQKRARDIENRRKTGSVVLPKRTSTP